jgi:hypothetical protein
LIVKKYICAAVTRHRVADIVGAESQFNETVLSHPEIRLTAYIYNGRIADFEASVSARAASVVRLASVTISRAAWAAFLVS